MLKHILALPVRTSKSQLYIKGPLLGLKQFLTIESPLKMMKNGFCFILKAIFVLEIFTFFV